MAENPDFCRELAPVGINSSVDELAKKGVLIIGSNGRWCNRRIPIIIPNGMLNIDIRCDGNCQSDCPRLQEETD